MRHYNNLFKINQDKNNIKKTNLKDIFREIQGKFIDSHYLSNLCADTSVNIILISLLLGALDSLKIFNSKLNSLEKKIRKNHLMNKNQDVQNDITNTLPTQINRDEFQKSEFATKVEYVNNTIPIELLGNEVGTQEHIGKVKNSSKNECVNQFNF